MALEAGSYISNLVPTNPDPTDNEAFGAQHLQLIKTALKTSLNGFPGVVLLTGTDAGAANAYAITPQTAITAYTTDMLALFTPVNANTGPSTLNIGGLGPKNIVHTNGVALASGDIPAGQFVLLAFDGTNFQLISADASKVDRNNGASTNQTLTTPTISSGTFSGAATVSGAINAAGATYTGAILNNATLTGTTAAPTPPVGDNSTKLATTAFAVQLAFAAAVPSQAGNAGKYLSTNGTVASWQTIIPPQVIRVPVTANAMLVASNNQNLIDITSGTFTQTFDTPANLGSGWFCWVKNSGSGNVTIPLSDGVSNWIMYPGEIRMFQCDGTTFNSVVVRPFYAVFTASANFIRPPGYSLFSGILWGGGGGGGKSTTTGAAAQAAGGGGGDCNPFTYASSALLSTEPVVIGAGGTAATASGVAAGIGGSSTFKATTAYGGGGGFGDSNGGNASVCGGAGGGAISAGASGFSGTFATGGGPRGQHAGTSSNEGFGGADSGGSFSAYYGGAGGSGSSGGVGGGTVYGGAGGGGIYNTTKYSPGTSVYGGAGGTGGLGAAASAGIAPGGGGGGADNGGAAGAGARGEFRIWGVV